MRRTTLTGAAIWVLLVTFGGQPAFSQSAPSDSGSYRRYDSGGADLRFDPNYDRTGVVNGGAKAGHCGGVKVGQSQCE
jgi:hypothetical protein